MLLAAVASTSPDVFVKAGKCFETKMSIFQILARTPADIVAFGQNLSIVITSDNASDLLYTFAGSMKRRLSNSP